MPKLIYMKQDIIGNTPVWYGTKEKYQQEKDSIPDGTIIIFIDDYEDCYTKDETDELIAPINNSLSYNAQSGYIAKNIFHGAMLSGTISSVNGAFVPSFTAYITSAEFIEIVPNETYTLSFTTNNNLVLGGIAMYGSDKSTFKGIGRNSTFTIPSDVSYIRLVLTKDDTTTINPTMASNIQIEQGTSASEYIKGSKSNRQITEELAEIDIPTTLLNETGLTTKAYTIPDISKYKKITFIFRYGVALLDEKTLPISECGNGTQIWFMTQMVDASETATVRSIRATITNSTTLNLIVKNIHSADRLKILGYK